MKLVAKGYSSKFISERFFLSEETIKIHRKNINKKLEIKNLKELITYATIFGLIEI